MADRSLGFLDIMANKTVDFLWDSNYHDLMHIWADKVVCLDWILQIIADKTVDFLWDSNYHDVIHIWANKVVGFGLNSIDHSRQDYLWDSSVYYCISGSS